MGRGACIEYANHSEQCCNSESVGGAGRRGQNGSVRKGPRCHIAVAVNECATAAITNPFFEWGRAARQSIQFRNHGRGRAGKNGPTAPAQRRKRETPGWVRADLRWNLSFALNRMLTSALERIAVLSRAGASGSQHSHGPSRESYRSVRKSRAGAKTAGPPTANAAVPAEGM